MTDEAVAQTMASAVGSFQVRSARRGPLRVPNKPRFCVCWGEGAAWTAFAVTSTRGLLLCQRYASERRGPRNLVRDFKNRNSHFVGHNNVSGILLPRHS